MTIFFGEFLSSSGPSRIQILDGQGTLEQGLAAEVSHLVQPVSPQIVRWVEYSSVNCGLPGW